MYRSQHRRNKDISVQPQPSSMPVVLPSHSQTSLTSSRSSSDASSSLPHSNSNQFDITASDQSLPLPSFSSATSSASKSRFFPLSRSANPRVPPSLSPQMGQSLSRPSPAPTSNESASSGSRLKRAWAGRRKKSEDVTVLLGGPSVIDVSGKGKERDASGSSTPSPSTPIAAKGAGVQVQQSRLVPNPVKVTKNIIPLQLASTLNVFGGNRRQSQSPKSPKFSGSAPLPAPISDTAEVLTDKKLPLTPTTPSPPLSTTVTSFAQRSLVSLHSDGLLTKEDALLPRDKPDHETKQDWRKSDSTMTSHITVRPGAFGNRSPRPVSLAESSHSGHTVVAVNKRLSALITDVDFAMPEEGDLDQGRSTGKPSPTPSLKAIHRRSMSLSPALGLRMKNTSPEPSALSEPHSLNTPISPVSPITSTRDTPTLTRAAAEGFITPSTPTGAAHSTSSNIRGRLTAWTTTTPVLPPSSHVAAERPLPSTPIHPRAAPAGHPPVSHPPSFRQTAVSMTGSLAPTAAGIAFGIGKRAAEKVHRVWGGFSSSSSSQSAYSSTSSVDQVGPASYHGHGHKRSEDLLGGRSASSQAITNHPPTGKSGWRGKSRTPNAPSGTWSVTSSTSSSVSECEALTMPSGPSLGTKFRGPRLNASGAPVAGGLVFSRQLDVCVEQTAIDRASVAATLDSCIKPLEDRALPALVVRCAQHILQWGVQEEGLFRVSGRPAHVAKLRSEFDTGADYNLVESDPSDLDPHAVASIFKAYLRELPESLLTTALVPQFDAIIATENTEAEASNHKSAMKAGIGSKGPTLPSGPRNGLSLRKPPSLSTLAMPNFAGMRSISPAGLEAVTALIARLPVENRDLLFTVTELIIATAARSKETKMPIGNLLVVFCPSLNMNPSLLRVFCDAKDIWNGPPQVPAVPELPSIAIHSEKQTGSDVSSAPTARPRPGAIMGRDPLATLYVPTDQSVSSMYQRSSSTSGSYVSALEGLPEPDTRPSSPSVDSPHMLPPLSSSTDSLAATPSTMSEASSFSQAPSLSSQSSAVEFNKKPEIMASPEPVIIENGDLPLPVVPRRPAVSTPIPFPSSADGSAPHTPLSSRKSFTLLSFPPLRSSEPSSAGSSSSSSSWGHSRSKRPSLHLLFSKKSTPSLRFASGNPDASPSSAPPMVTDYLSSPGSLRPHSALDRAPPALTTPISSSPMKIGFDEPVFQSNIVVNDEPSIAPEDTIRLVHARTDSTTSSLYSTPQETPIADRFHGRFPLVAPPLKADQVVATSAEMPRSPSQLSLTPSISIGFDEDDWAQSVLSATSADGKEEA